MTIWTPRQMHQVMGLGISLKVDAYTANGPDLDHVRQWVRDKVTSALRGSAATFAVDIHDDDVDIAEETTTDWKPWTYRGRWMPQGRPASLLGGPHDGDQYVVAQDQLWQPIFTLPLGPTLMTEPQPIATLMEKHVYHLETWDEGARHWVFRYGGSA